MVFFCLMKSQLRPTGYVTKPLYCHLHECRLPDTGPSISKFTDCSIPEANTRFQRSWKDLSYKELAFKIFSLYISSSEIPPDDLKGIIDRSYSTFREEDVTPLVHLKDDNLYLLELFHGPSYSFKDCGLFSVDPTSLS